MALHPEFPTSPYAPLIPEHRWFPADETLRDNAYEKLLPPLVSNIRAEVHSWRNAGYPGASQTSVSLLQWWFETEHLLEAADGALSPFQYYFAQREAVETVIWLHDVRKARDKFDLLRFDASGFVSHGMFSEDWPRYVLKMATGPADYRSVVAFFARQLLKDLRMVGGYDVLYPRVRDFMKFYLFEPQSERSGDGRTGNLQSLRQMDTDKQGSKNDGESSSSENIRVHACLSVVPLHDGGDLEDPVVLRNLSEPDAGKILYDSFKVAMNALTIADTGTTRIEDHILRKNPRPFRTEHRPYLEAGKSIFTRIKWPA
jgi:hypothetical protein